MQIVIDIPEEVFNEIVSADDASHLSRAFLKGSYLYFKEALKNGTPLKRHGRLIDADRACEGNCAECPVNDICMVNKAPTVIEADKEGQEDGKA